MNERMIWASAVSEAPETRRAAQMAAARTAEQIGGAPPDLAFVFFTGHHRSDPVAILEAVAETLLPRNLLGCSAGGVIGEGREIEQRPGLSITAGRLPGVDIQPFRLEDASLPDEDAPPLAWEDALSVHAAGSPQFVILADPFSFRADALLLGLDYAFPKSAKVGGLASATERAGQNALLLNGDSWRDGCVGVALTGAIAVDTVVAQGCRPIGQPMRVTRARANMLAELDGRTPLDVLTELLPSLSDRDQQLARTSLFLGVGLDPYQDHFRQGDFLIRNILGVSPDGGALAVGEALRVGQAVQFHLRDALTSAEDVDLMIGRYAEEMGARGAPGRPAGALLFSCLGRGVHLYGRADHDTEVFREKVGDIPLGGFFCNGEIGTVRGQTRLHGFTSSFAVFRSPA